MLSEKDNELLTQVGPGTPMGELMRRYWHPIAASQELEDNPFRTKEVRILGEDLVLYKDRRGNLGLIERFCAHRRVNLAIGVVEEDGLRCQYHGWKFDATGRCVEQPFEDTTHPEDRFRDRCGLKGYPVQEKAGLVFAYLGPEPAPLFPAWEPYTWENVASDICITDLPVNWLQCQENSLDPVHTEWLHGYFAGHVTQLAGLQAARALAPRAPHKKIGFDLFDYGIIKRRVQGNGSEEDDDWKVGHPILFPNILLVGSQFSATMQFRVPVDDTHTYHVSLYVYRGAPGVDVPRQESVPYRHVPLQNEDGHWILNYVFNQDYMAWVTQGDIAKRHREKLGKSDEGIIMFRQLLKDQMKLVEQGQDPMCVIRDAARNARIELPLEPIKFGERHRPTYRPAEAGFSRDAALIDQVLASWDAIPDFAANGHSGTNGKAEASKREVATGVR